MAGFSRPAFGTVACRPRYRSVPPMCLIHPTLASLRKRKGRWFACGVVRIIGKGVAAWLIACLKFADTNNNNPSERFEFVQGSRALRFGFADGIASLSCAEIGQAIFARSIMREQVNQQFHAIA